MGVRRLLLILFLFAITALVPASLAFGDGNGSNPPEAGNGNSGQAGHDDDDDDESSNEEPTTTTNVTSTAPPTTASNGGEPAPTAGDGLPPAGPPVLGRAVAVGSVSGTVRVRLPGTSRFVVLSRAAQVPAGAVLDTTRGVVSMTAAGDARGAVQSATFTGATFSVAQRRRARPVTDLVLRGGDFGSCRRPAANRAFAVAARRPVRRLWGSGHGRFRTRGRYGSAAVRGTTWLTEDRCEGTRVRVVRGRVAVRDMVRHKTVMVSAGHAHLVRARR